MESDIKQVKVLIVDDNVSNRKFLDTIFIKEGYSINHANDISEAMQEINNHLPDIILLDIVMPDMIGRELFNILKENDDYSNIPIIIMTSLDDIESKKNALALEADDYLIRPFDHSEVLLRTRNLLRIKSSHAYAANIDDLTTKIDPITELMNTKATEEALNYILYETNYVSLLMIQLLGLEKTISALDIEKVNAVVKILADRVVSYGILINNSTVGHFGQGKFLFILPEFKRFQLDELCTKLRKSLASPIKINNNEVFIKVAIGAATYPSDGANASTLIACADIALINSSENSEVTYYNNTMHNLSEQKLKFEADLYHAIENKELEQYYQPIVDLKSKKIIGVEALIRWNKSGLSIPPEQFIPTVEELGLMPEFHQWTLDAIEDSIHYWSNISCDFYISINISPKLFFSINFAEKLINLSKFYAKKVRFVAEVTEGCLIEDIKTGIEILTRLKNNGIESAIDDFGTGFSSFSYLKSLPASIIKIDKSFINELANNKKSKALVHSIIQLAENMDMTVIAEGVETQSQLDILARLKCNSVQGFVFYLPMSKDEFYQAYLATVQ
jgi:EAL domain-containing protein (putative c-di-GMP-specific phosphodiesterase class I)/DNA-binding response OmpR family regulator